jgi:hypothetical protein
LQCNVHYGWDIYNNPIYSSGVTPFQAGTQVVQTMCENSTKNKKIVSVFLGNVQL